MKRSFIIIFTLFFNSLFSQTKPSKNNHIFLEGLGSIGYYSVNIDKTIYKSVNFRDYIRVGFSVTQDSWTVALWPGKPFGFYLQYSAGIMIGTENGTKRWRREISLGILEVHGEPVRQYNLVAGYGDKYISFGIISSLGFRYYVEKIPLFFRFSYTPFYDITQKKLMPIFVGTSVGYSF